MPAKIQTITRGMLESAPLPMHGPTYTVVPHSKVIQETKDALKHYGFRIVNEFYRATKDCSIAQGIYHLYSQNDSDMGLMFAWSNSYDKSHRFRCAIGSHVFVCSNGMVSGNMNSYSRKHTGTADIDVISAIDQQLVDAKIKFALLIKDKEQMKQVILDDKQQAELVGRLLLHEKLLTPNQVSIVKKEVEDPSHYYNADPNSVWTIYNHVTNALKESHPRYWLEDHQQLHDFVMAEYAGIMGLQNKDKMILVDDVETEIAPSIIEL
jgi:hypothetical protein